MKRFTRNTTCGILVGGALIIAAYIPQASAGLVSPTYVTVGNTQWAQASLFTNVSWNEAANVCSSTTGACSGSLNGYDLTGWTWASSQGATTMFNAFLPAADRLTQQNGYAVYGILEAGTQTALSDAGFIPTEYAFAYYWTYSFLTRSYIAPGIVAAADWFYPVPDSLITSAASYTNSGLTTSQDASYAGAGMEFYKVATVPEPPTLALLGLGLVAMGAMRRKKKARNS